MKRFLRRFSVYLLATSCYLLATVPVHAYTNNMPASVVIGQENFINTESNSNAGDSGPISGRGVNNPMGLVSNGNNLIVSDSGNNRVLIFNQIPTINGVSADVVIGQENLQGGSADQGGSAASNTLDTPRGVIMVGNKLLIADRANNRVLLWNSIPTQNNARADVVIGQPDMTTVSSGTTSTKMNQPAGLYYDEDTGKLFISEWGNDRVLIYNRLPTANGSEASAVIGQTNLTSSGTGTTAAKFNNPTGIKVINGKLYIADLSNNRILVWNAVPTSNGASADIAIGQTNLNPSHQQNQCLELSLNPRNLPNQSSRSRQVWPRSRNITARINYP